MGGSALSTSSAQVGVNVVSEDNIDFGATKKASINTQADAAFASYDPPTKTEMDAGHALLATEAKQDIIDTNVDDIETDTGTTLPATLATIAGYLDTEIAAIKAKTDLLPSGVAKNVALSNFIFFMKLASNHFSPATGKTITATMSKDGAAFVACTNSVAEIGSGFYKISFTQAEMNYNTIGLLFTEINCDQLPLLIVTST